MKKFTFTLHKILNFREQILEKEKNLLNELNMSVKLLESKIVALLEEKEKAEREFKERTIKGVLKEEINSHSFKMICAEKKQEELQKKLQKARQDVNLQTRVVVVASQEVKKLEKLKEKQIEEYKYSVQKAEAEQISEQVIIKVAYDKVE